jgi:gliding motility-associated-like protein
VPLKYIFYILLILCTKAFAQSAFRGTSINHLTTDNRNLSVEGTSIGGIINNYTPVISLIPCRNKIIVEDAASFNNGDTVMMIQMKGAVIDSTNSASFGTITDYKSAGNYEINFVKSKSGNTIELKNKITRSYDLPEGKVQLIRIPYFQNVRVTNPLSCLPWDGKKGGVLVLNVLDSIILEANIDVSGKGFRGGIGYNTQTPVLNCNQNNFFYPQSSNSIAGQKGESIYEIGSSINYGKGSPATGGGGGLGHNSGGGGGSNGGTGGFGGYQLEPCGNAPFNNRGIGGHPITYSSSTNKIFLGGGGGAGQADNPGNSVPDGGHGGGIVIIMGNKVKANGFKILANGNGAATCSMPPSSDCHDGMGGGGGAGTVLISVNNYLDNITIENKGGKGADMIGSVSLGGRIGAGGGGSGGLLFINAPSLPSPVINVNAGGTNGVLVQDGNSSWGATPGQSGTTLFNLKIPVDTSLFRFNIDSVRIKDSLITCNNLDFKGYAFVNTNAIQSWQWDFGDGGTANSQNASHSYAPGNYNVKLIVTDINGCTDSITKNVTASLLALNTGPNDTICSNSSTTLQASATGTAPIQFQWSPAAYVSNPNILNPVATPPASTWFYLTAINANGCSRKDSVFITVRSANAFSINNPTGICPGNTYQLSASGGDLYAWQPSATLNNAFLSNPMASPLSTTVYSVLITDTLCNYSKTLSTTITVHPLPTIKATRSNDIDCSFSTSQLSATGGIQYTWAPVSSLNNGNIINPVASPLVTTKYSVTGKDINGCINSDTVTVKVTAANRGGYLMPTGFTPNNDGHNDCYGIKYWGSIQELEFSIYNRWGERVFFTKNPTECWNGKYNGVLQDPAVFIFMIKAKTSCDSSVFRKGTFVLIR